jgi:adenine-specific DNA-methyltransferase
MPQLTWVGKDKVKNHHHDVPFRLLNTEYRFTAHAGTPANSTQNRIIHGDNLEALKSLLPELEGRVNCIYIDPPYNTGNEGWVYNDNVNDPKIKKWLGQVVGKEGEDLSRHDKWLCMMYPRLKLLHRLLADDGVIFVSIDDNEQAHLKLVMDEVFGAGNFVANFVWHHRKSSQNDTDVSLSHNYTFCFSKNRKNFKLKPLGIDESKFSNLDNDIRGDWVADPMDAPNIRENLTYPITNPNTGDVFYPPQGRHWRFTQDKFIAALNDNRIVFGKTGKSKPQLKRFLSEAQDKGTNPFTIWSDIETATDATKDIMSIFDGDKVFDTPKPVQFIERILKLSTTKNAIILDSFAGSGTTAHAVLKQNAQDGGNRRFILIEMMDYAETITAERVRRVMNGYGEGNKAVAGLGGGFEYVSVGEALFLDDGNLNEAVGEAAIRQYVAYSERVTLDSSDTMQAVNPHCLGLKDDALFVFYYEADAITALSMDFLATLAVNTLPQRPSGYVIYADKCTLTDEIMQKYGIRFKRIPRDITRF